MSGNGMLHAHAHIYGIDFAMFHHRIKNEDEFSLLISDLKALPADSEMLSVKIR